MTSMDDRGVVSPYPGEGAVDAAGATDVDEWVSRTRLPMLRVAHMIVGSRAIAEELVQDAYAQMLTRLEGVENRDAYLRSTVVNLCRSHLRRRGLERRHVVTERVVLESLEIDETWATVLGLPFRQRAVLVLRYYSDLSEAQTAASLQSTPDE